MTATSRRAVAQRCPDPPMRNLVTFGGQHQGVFGKYWILEQIDSPSPFDLLCELRMNRTSALIVHLSLLVWLNKQRLAVLLYCFTFSYVCASIPVQVCEMMATAVWWGWPPPLLNSRSSERPVMVSLSPLLCEWSQTRLRFKMVASRPCFGPWEISTT